MLRSYGAFKVCRRCGGPLPQGNPYHGFCSSRHRREAKRQWEALVAAGPGCTRCFRGAVFFEWRQDGGRQRAAAPNLEGPRLAACWCEAGKKLGRSLEIGYKAWGYMLDYNLEGGREIAPRIPLIVRAGIEFEGR